VKKYVGKNYTFFAYSGGSITQQFSLSVYLRGRSYGFGYRPRKDRRWPGRVGFSGIVAGKLFAVLINRHLRNA
jgi:hypothetical protein